MLLLLPDRSELQFGGASGGCFQDPLGDRAALENLADGGGRYAELPGEAADLAAIAKENAPYFR
jgi:hypothetical protein